ncbi:MAG: OmpA family protein [Burkholderiaceae bacterium]
MSQVPRAEIRTEQGWRSLDRLSLLLALLLAAALFWLWPGRSTVTKPTTPSVGTTSSETLARNNTNQPTTVPAAAQKPQSQPEPTPAVKPQPQTEPAPVAKPEPKPESTPATKPAPTLEPTPSAEPTTVTTSEPAQETKEASPGKRAAASSQTSSGAASPEANKAQAYCRALQRSGVIRVSFGAASTRLNNATREELNAIATCLKSQGGSFIVGGHTDNAGNSIDNLLLSVERARIATAHLIDNGVNPNQLEYRGFGQTQPIADNWTSSGRAKNRRVEIRRAQSQ